MAEPAKTDDALTLAVRDAFQKHLEKARANALAKADPKLAEGVRRSTLVPPPPANDPPQPIEARAPEAPKPDRAEPFVDAPPRPQGPQAREPVQEQRASPIEIPSVRVESEARSPASTARERLVVLPPRSRTPEPTSAVRPEAGETSTLRVRLPIEQATRDKAASTLGRLPMLIAAAVIGVALIGAATWQFLQAPAPTVPADRPAPAATAPLQPAPATTAAAPAAPAPAATETAAPVVTRTVSTMAIKLDDIDMAVQEARERIAIGDVGMARLKLAAIQSDARALFVLAESYDPSIVTMPSMADPKIAATYYEQAKAAGHPGADERIANLRLSE